MLAILRKLLAWPRPAPPPAPLHPRPINSVTHTYQVMFGDGVQRWSRDQIERSTQLDSTKVLSPILREVGAPTK